MNTYILIQKRQDKKKPMKYLLLALILTINLWTIKYIICIPRLWNAFVYTIPSYFISVFHITCTDSIAIIYILWISYFMRVYVIPQFHCFFCIKMLEYKIFSVKFYHLGKFHIVDICLINKSKILKSTGCASHDFTQILINTLLLIRNL